MNPRNPEVSRMVVDVPSDGVGDGDYDGRSRDRCRHWAACEGEPSRPELLCSRMRCWWTFLVAVMVVVIVVVVVAAVVVVAGRSAPV